MDKIIRKDDRVRIIDPYIFVRCGYPMSIDGAIAEIDQKYEKEIIKFITGLNITGIEKDTNVSLAFKNNNFVKAYEEICRALGYYLMKQKKFGGNKRSVYTENVENLKGQTGIVLGIKYVKTGEYVPDSYVNDDYGYEDYVPAYLKNQKTHKILTVRTGTSFFDIEDIHVEKIK